MKNSILFWIKKNKFQVLALVLILALGLFFRIYRIGEYMTFLGDEGRDVLIVKRLLKDGNLVFVGPGTSVGNMYLGPFYYYFMAPFLFIFNYNPVGPAVGIALLGTLTIFLVWYVALKWFGSWAAFVSALLYAVSPVVIVYSRHSWNPNIMPFFSLLVIYFLWRFWRDNNFKCLYPMAISLAICLQSHYLSLILLPFVLFFLVLSFIKAAKENKLKALVISFSISLLLFSALMSPLFLFDAKHNWRNLGAMKDLFFQKGGSISFSFLTPWVKFWSVWEKLITRLLAAKDLFLGKFLACFIFLLVLGKLTFDSKKKKISTSSNFLFLIGWIFSSVFFLTFYKEEIYDHYFGFLFPAPFLLVGSLVQDSHRRFSFWLLLILSLALVAFNLFNSPLKDRPNNQLQRSIDVARKIVEESNGDRFNLAVIAEKNYEGAYQYFLELWQAPLVLIDPQKADQTITNQLFVVCEYEDRNKCQPTSNPKAEVANFGWSKVDQVWKVDGVLLYRLVHSVK